MVRAGGLFSFWAIPFTELRGASALGPVFYGNRTKYYDQNRPNKRSSISGTNGL